MALPINVSDLMNQRVIESARIEYKADWNPEPILHSICAFANDIDNWGGGYIVIGVEEENGMPKLPVKGLEKSAIDRINKELLQKCNLIEPRYLPVVEQVSYEGKEILMVWAPGGADRTISSEDLQNCRLVSRRYRNRRIGDFLKELKLVEGRNTGIPTILAAMQANGSERPRFETDEERTYFTVVLPVHKSFLNAQPPAAPAGKQRRSRAELKELAVAALREQGPLSTSELALALGYQKITSALYNGLKELMAEGVVRYSEPEKPRSKNQKLCLVKRRKKE